MALPTDDDGLPTDAQELVVVTRDLVTQAHRLSESINDAIEELAAFTADIKKERRKLQEPFNGGERRHGES